MSDVHKDLDAQEPAPKQAPATLAKNPAENNQDQFSVKFREIATEGTKYTLFVIFALYSIGFIIWHSYLGSYGVSSVAFLQADYLAAAFCYLFLIVTFAVPPFLILKAIQENIKSKGLLGMQSWNNRWILVVIIWYYLASRITVVFLPNLAGFTGRGLYLFSFWGAIAAVHLMVALICGVKGGALWGRFMEGNNWKGSVAQNEFRNSRFYRCVVRHEYFGLYTFSYLMLSLIFNPNISGKFLASSVFLYFSVIFSVGYHVSHTWKESSLAMRALIVAVNSLILVSNIQTFAINQFGEIPKSVGGGKPEISYFKFRSDHLDIAKELNIPSASDSGLSTNIFGPVGILLRSEQEVVFINYKDTYAPEYLTNSIVQIVTNSFPIKTNFVAASVGRNQFKTNEVITIEQKINTTISEAVVENPTKFTARQVRSELIDSIVFTRLK